MMLLWLLSVVLLLGGVSCKRPTLPVDRALAAAAAPPQEWNFNSGSEQVWYGNDMIYENYLGKRSLEYDANFTRSSQYRICSNSKLFVAVGIMQLVEQGVISSIYDSIDDYLTPADRSAWGLPDNSTFCPMVYNSSSGCQNISFVSLMSMSSGIIAAVTCDYSPDQWQYAYCIPTVDQTIYPGSIATTISYFIQNPLASVPGPAYSNVTNNYWYSNENFIILSYMIETLSGQSLSDYLQEHILTPMGLQDTLYDPYSQAFALQKELVSEYYHYTNYLNSSEPFAYGSCGDTEVNPGFQAGSGGMISTGPDMAKWYASLFIQRNTTVLTDASIDQILFPWSLSGSSPFWQYYGLGVELMYPDPYTSLPAVDADIQAPNAIYYMGGSMCTFFSIVIVNSTTNLFTGEPLITLPMMAMVARNNRILNITEDIYSTIPSMQTGTWYSITGWPSGWGSANGDLTDTLIEALNLAYYFAALPYTPTTATSTSSGTDSCDDKDNTLIVLLATLLPCLAVMAAMLAYFLYFWAPKTTSTSGVTASLSKNAMV